MSNVLDFKRIRLTHDDRRHRPGECAHLHLKLDSRGGIVSCVDCKTFLSPFWALSMLSEQYKHALATIEHLSSRLTLAEERTARTSPDPKDGLNSVESPLD